MAHKTFRTILGILLWIIIPGMALGMGAAKEAPRMTKEGLKSMLGRPDLIILDVRASGDWDQSREKIQGAVREDPNKSTKSWAEKYSKEKTIVLYCAWPREGTSARVAQELISLGYKKVYALKGGWKDWAKANFPMEPK